ncbi:MAG: hypothetical protein MUC88_20775 [Planctomycetes bacterium]|jgi:hypothetical protein|nr:hypothetical protein [Planctomycetota bacterium]
MDKHLAQLIGKTVTTLVKSTEDIGTIYGLMFKDGTIAWIMQDPEGNGPGHLDIARNRNKKVKRD